MIITFFCLIGLAVLFWIGLKLTGALLSALLWLFLWLPLALVMIVTGIIICCTILLIPAGIWLIKSGIGMMIPISC